MSDVGASSNSAACDGPHRVLVQAFDDLLSSFLVDKDLAAVFERVVALATAAVPACDEASISILDERGRLTTPCATAKVVIELDNKQYESGQGPCVSAITGVERAVYSPDLGTDSRWPQFGRVAAAQGFHSLFSRRFDGGGPVGGINLYARRAEAFAAEDSTAATLLSAFAGVVTALTRARMESSNLREALQSRDVIGQAKGILMERHRIAADVAFDILRRASQHQNRKLRDIADEIATTGQDPSHL
jgi:hypothetical protein